MAQDFGGAHGQANGVACLHAGGQCNAQHRGQLAGDVVTHRGAVACRRQADAQGREFAAHEDEPHAAHGGAGHAIAHACRGAARRHDHDRDGLGLTHRHHTGMDGGDVQVGVQVVQVRAHEGAAQLGLPGHAEAVELADLAGIGQHVGRRGDRDACAADVGTAQTQLVAAVADHAVASQVRGHDGDGVERARQGRAQLAFARNGQAPDAAGGIEHQARHGDAGGAVDRDRGACGHAVDHVVDTHHQLLGVAGVVGARQGRCAAAGVAEKDRGCGRWLGVDVRAQGGAGRAPVARQVVLDDAQVVNAGGQVKAAEAVDALCVGGGGGDHSAMDRVAQAVQARVAGAAAVVEQAHLCRRGGQPGDHQGGRQVGDAICAARAAVASGRQTGRVQRLRGAGVDAEIERCAFGRPVARQVHGACAQGVVAVGQGFTGVGVGPVRAV